MFMKEPRWEEWFVDTDLYYEVRLSRDWKLCSQVGLRKASIACPVFHANVVQFLLRAASR